MAPSGRAEGGGGVGDDGDGDESGDEGDVRVVYDAANIGGLSPGGDGAPASPRSFEGEGVVDDVLVERGDDAAAEGAGPVAGSGREEEEDKAEKTAWIHDDADEGFAQEPFLKEPFQESFAVELDGRPKPLSAADNSPLGDPTISTQSPMEDGTTEDIIAAAEQSQGSQLTKLYAPPQSTKLENDNMKERSGGGARNEGSASSTPVAIGRDRSSSISSSSSSNSVHIGGEESAGVAAGGDGMFSAVAGMRDMLSRREWLSFRKPAVSDTMRKHHTGTAQYRRVKPFIFES